MAWRDAIELEDAVTLLLDAFGPPGTRFATLERVVLEEVPGRIAGEDVAALLDQPPFDRSPLDGFALRHDDTQNASRERPVLLEVADCIHAGDAGGMPLASGKAARIMTGAPLPPGADCVVRQEDVSVQADGRVAVPLQLKRHENFSHRGENLQAGEILVRRGDRMDSGRVALLAGEGHTHAAVFPRVKVGILSTGSELIRGGEPAGPGKIYDNNRVMLAARVHELGFQAPQSRSVGDDPETIAHMVRELLSLTDIVVTTGGVSVGDRDHLPEAIALLEATTLFHGVRIKPGTPAMAARCGEKPVLCLSGNPFAAKATFEVLAIPLLRLLAGDAQPRPERMECRLAQPFSKSGPMRRITPGIQRGEIVVFPETRGNHRSLAGFRDCNCLVDFPPSRTGFAAGTAVEVLKP